MNTKKGAAPLFTGMMVFVLSVLLMITVVAFIVPYFNTLKDSIDFKNNKENLLAINNTLLELKDNYIGSKKQISVYSNNDIEFNKEKKKIIIKQNLNNQETYQKTPNEQIFNNLVIKKENNELVFELDLTEIVDLNESFIINAKTRQKINFEIIEYDQIPKIEISRVPENIFLEFVKSTNNKITLKNLSSDQKYIITDYKINTNLQITPLNNKINLETPITINENEEIDLNIICMPETIFGITIYLENEEINLPIMTEDFDPTYCYSDGLVGWWRFEENTLDSSNYNNHGTAYGENYTEGIIGKAYSFDGSTSYINCGNDSSLSSLDGLSISAWVKTDSFYGGIVVKGQEGTWQNNEYGLRSSSNQIRFYITNEYNFGGLDPLIDNTYTTLPTTDWFHYVARTSKDLGKLEVYINGQLVEETARTVNDLGGTKNRILYIGKGYSTTFFTGLLDEIRIYNKALTPEEIKEIYNLEKPN